MEILFLLCSVLSTFFTSSILSLPHSFRSLLRRRPTSAAGVKSVSLYQGTVWHERRLPLRHSFQYSVRYALIDLDLASHPPPNHLFADDCRSVTQTNGPVSNLRAIGNFDFEISKIHCLHDLHQRGERAPSSTKKNVQELHKAFTDEGPKFIKDDVIFHTFGPERRRSVRGLGFGALPSKVDAQVHQNEHVRKLEGKVLDLEQQLNEIRAMLIKERRQNDGTNPFQRSSDLLQSTPYVNLPTSVNEVGSVTESIEAMKLSKRASSSIANLPTGLDADQSNGVSSLQNVKCKLLHWEGSNLVVAEGQIASRDPKSKVHHVTLGPLCWKVWVNHVAVNVPLFRSTHEMYDLQDAIGSTVAWPSQFILLD
ncbi:hypothetical protein HYC85_018836 [Camellia sinensis]|uniref:DUF8039 domain-containing protein n=1 Tax=Camellia sinensis TaxID=4442 RepID=A0A7J7GVG8_CAMSI|nr:hypothetical protein HYC85_018836 [Camellia sinensis]